MVCKLLPNTLNVHTGHAGLTLDVWRFGSGMANSRPIVPLNMWHIGSGVTNALNAHTGHAGTTLHSQWNGLITKHQYTPVMQA